MAQILTHWLIDRRTLLGSAFAMLSSGVGGRFSAQAAGAPAEPSAAYQAVYTKIIGSATPEVAKVTLDLPEIAENGNIVPYKIDIDHPMLDADHVRTIILLSTGNPQPLVATFHLSPLSGKAAVSGRMRLARTQDVVVLAELSDGRILKGSRVIEVTIGGCGN